MAYVFSNPDVHEFLAASSRFLLSQRLLKACEVGRNLGQEILTVLRAAGREHVGGMRLAKRAVVLTAVPGCGSREVSKCLFVSGPCNPAER